MISEALGLRVDDERLIHNWYMCVYIHGYGGLSGDRYGGAGWYACGTQPGRIGRMSGDSAALPVCEMIHW